jgi:hypothetical protein
MSEEGQTPTGATDVERNKGIPPLVIPTTEVAPTSVKGRTAASVGVIITAVGTCLARLTGFPVPVLISLIITGGFVTSVYVLSVMAIKDRREARAAAKDLALIKAATDGVTILRG